MGIVHYFFFQFLVKTFKDFYEVSSLNISILEQLLSLIIFKISNTNTPGQFSKYFKMFMSFSSSPVSNKSIKSHSGSFTDTFSN